MLHLLAAGHRAGWWVFVSCCCCRPWDKTQISQRHQHCLYYYYYYPNTILFWCITSRSGLYHVQVLLSLRRTPYGGGGGGQKPRTVALSFGVWSRSETLSRSIVKSNNDQIGISKFSNIGLFVSECLWVLECWSDGRGHLNVSFWALGNDTLTRLIGVFDNQQTLKRSLRASTGNAV